jgi:HEAT repeat protein
LETPLQALEREVARFREWADTETKAAILPVSELGGEWEFEYKGWQSLYRAAFDVLDSLPLSEWDEETKALLLFVLARDNEGEIIAEELVSRPEILLILAKASIRSTDAQAKWQIATQLSKLGEGHAAAQSLLETLARDEDEYVRRRALMSLGVVGSPMLESFVDAAWETGDEYQRMAVLTALRNYRSPRLEDFLTRAEFSRQAYLSAHASRIRAEEA